MATAAEVCHRTEPNEDSPGGGRPEVHLRVDRRCAELVSRQWVSLPREKLFGFFGDARNLEQITPPFLNFRVLAMSTPDVRRGTVIRYRLKLHGIPLRWRTVIDRWEPPAGFTDRQASGPFATWVHEHEFIPENGGTLLVDRVRFRARFHGLLNSVFLAWILRDLKRIFTYRQLAITRLLDVHGDLSRNVGSESAPAMKGCPGTCPSN
jgi:ligand-binding SRPBCC domain-containing protein